MEQIKLERVLLNVGCGQTRPGGWINTDCSLNSLAQSFPFSRAISRRFIKSQVYVEPARFMNLSRRWPFADGAVDVVYASHVFEHLSIRQASHFLKEAHRVLVQGGAVRIVVPDLYQLSKRYVTEYEAGRAAANKDYMWALNLHLENTSPPGQPLKKFLHWMQGFPHQHKFMYDLQTLRERIKAYPFRDLKDAVYGRSDYISEISDVECTGEGVPAIYVEARK